MPYFAKQIFLCLLHLIGNARLWDFRGKLKTLLVLLLWKSSEKLCFDIAHLSDIAAIYFLNCFFQTHTLVFIFCIFYGCEVLNSLLSRQKALVTYLKNIAA